MIIAVIQILLFQITSKNNQTTPNKSTITFLNPAGCHQRPASAALKLLHLKFEHVMPDDLVIKLPKFGKLRFGLLKYTSAP